MRQSTPDKKRRLALVLFSVLAFGGGAFYVTELLKSRNDPHLVGVHPGSLRIIPRSQYVPRPLVSLPWFGGNRLHFPVPKYMPVDWREDPLSSGILVWDGPITPLPPGAWGPHPGNALPIGLAENMVLTSLAGAPITQERDHTFFSSDIRYYPIPYVFGAKRQTFKFSERPNMPTLPNTQKLPEFLIELPALGKPAPKLAEKVFRDGPLEVRFTPVEWLGPSFGRVYDITATGLKPDQILLVSNQRTVNQRTRRGLVREPNNLFWVRVETGKSSRVSIVGDALAFDASVVTPRKSKVIVSTQSVATGPPSKSYFYRDTSGKTLATGSDYVHKGERGGRTQLADPLSGLQLQNSWVGIPYELQCLDSVGTLAHHTRPHFRAGTYDAVIYEPSKTYRFQTESLGMPMQKLLAYVKAGY